MPHTSELLDHLREALRIADAANDYLISAYITTPISLLEDREARRLNESDPSC